MNRSTYVQQWAYTHAPSPHVHLFIVYSFSLSVHTHSHTHSKKTNNEVKWELGLFFSCHILFPQLIYMLESALQRCFACCWWLLLFLLTFFHADKFFLFSSSFNSWNPQMRFGCSLLLFSLPLCVCLVFAFTSPPALLPPYQTTSLLSSLPSSAAHSVCIVSAQMTHHQHLPISQIYVCKQSSVLMILFNKIQSS